MKQYLFLATAIATASLFTGCSNNEYVGDQPEVLNGTDGAIVFSMGKANTTRGAELRGNDDANKLNGVFYVYGEKTVKDVAKTVFDTYKVKYDASTNNTSASNTTGWEYVLTNPWEDNEKANVGGGVDNQTIKYWDYSASQYTFYAFSANPDDVKGSTPKIEVSKIDKSNSTDPSYTVTIHNKAADIGALYFADKKEVTKTGNGGYAGPDDTPASKAVKLQFRNLASKVRVGFYETVPGYQIKINKMYEALDDGTAFKSEANTASFVAMCLNYKAQQLSKITVKYGTSTVGTLNQAYVADKKDENGVNSLAVDQTLTLGGGVFADPLATTSSSPTWDNSGKYTFFWPQTDNKPLKIKVDYTLTAEDKGASDPVDKPEKIEVKGATATIPAEYVKWKANTAYTYIFKISKNTNGTTGTGEDPKGLYPITFDAVVEDMVENTYLTTVSTLSVTASQDGTNFETPGAGFVFKLDKQITLKVMQNETDITDQATITGGYINGIYVYNKTPEQNLTDNSGNIGNSITFTNGKTLPEQSNAGYWVLKVVKDSATTYVIIRVGNAEDPANPSNP